MCKNGFTLVEIMVVVAIIVILIALTVPNMLRSRMTANEVAAIANCRTISNACQAYYANRIPHMYPPIGLSDLIAPESNPPYIDNALAGATDADHAKQGYYYVYTYIDAEHFTLKANPKVYGRTGNRYFYVDETGVIKANSTQEAGPNDTPIP
jgi:prepilin-type N-terminal cleavage/methylation domain-containing protein